MAFASYVTLPEFKAWRLDSETTDDVVATSVLESVTRWVDEYCDRHFWQDGEESPGDPVARTFTPCHSHMLPIDDLVSVTTFKTDEGGDGTFETSRSVSDYQLQPVNQPTGRPYTKVEAVAGRLFPVRYDYSRGNRVEITGVWGWPAVPDAVKQACLIQSHRVLKRRYSPEGVLGPSDFGAIRVGTRLDPDVEQLLNPYRRVGVRVA
jgi:hypothetical protein